MVNKNMPKTSNLHEILDTIYALYKDGMISEKKYLTLIRPIDMEIDKLEMATLQDSPVWKEAFLQHIPKLEH